MRAKLSSPHPCRPCTPTRDRVRGGRRLGDYLAGRQASLSHTCWITFHWRGMSSSVSVTSSPILRNRLPPQQWAKCSGSGRRAGLRRSNDGTVMLRLAPWSRLARRSPSRSANCSSS